MRTSAEIIELVRSLRALDRHSRLREQHLAALELLYQGPGMGCKIEPEDIQTIDRLGNILIEKASKEQLVKCGRLLALNLVHHQGKYGDSPMEKMSLLPDTVERATRKQNS